MNKNDIGQRERLTQNRIVALFRDKDKLDYDYLGNWEERSVIATSRRTCCVPFSRSRATIRTLSTGPCSSLSEKRETRARASTTGTELCMNCCGTA